MYWGLSEHTTSLKAFRTISVSSDIISWSRFTKVPIVKQICTHMGRRDIDFMMAVWALVYFR